MGYNDLDNLIKVKSDKLPWHEDDSESYSEAIDHVAKRFNFKSEERKPENKTPKRQILPFYSHKGDIFSDPDENPFIEDVNEDELEIGVLSSIQGKLLRDDVVTMPRNSKMDDLERNFYITALDALSSTLEHKYVIQIDRVKDTNGNFKINFAVSLFPESFSDILRHKRSSMFYNGVSLSDVDYAKKVSKIMGQFNNYLKFVNEKVTNYIAHTINEIFNIRGRDERNIPYYVINIRNLYALGSHMTYSNFNKCYSEAQSSIFKFSEYIMKEFTSRYTYEFIMELENDMVFILEPEYKVGFLSFIHEFTELLCDKLYTPDIENKRGKMYYREKEPEQITDLVDINLISKVQPRKRKTHKPSWE